MPPKHVMSTVMSVISSVKQSRVPVTLARKLEIVKKQHHGKQVIMQSVIFFQALEKESMTAQLTYLAASFAHNVASW